MNWLKKALNWGLGNSSTELGKASPAPGSRRQALAVLFARLEELDRLRPGLGARAAQYFGRPFDDESKRFLEEVARTPGTAAVLLGPPEPGAPAAREFREVVLARPVLPPATYALLALLIRSARNADGRSVSHAPRGMLWVMDLVDAITDRVFHYSQRSGSLSGWPAEDLVAVLKALRYEPDRLVELAFHWDLRYSFPPGETFGPMPGFGGLVAAHPDPLRSLLREGSAEQREWAVGVMKACRVPPEPILDLVLDLVLGTSQQVREASTSLLDGLDAEGLRVALEARLPAASAEGRERVVDLLWRRFGEGARPFLEDWRGREKADRVRRVLQALLDGPTGEPTHLEVPPEEDHPIDGPLGPGVREVLRRVVEALDEDSRRRHQAGGAPTGLFGQDGFLQLVRRLETGRQFTVETYPVNNYWLSRNLHESLELVNHPELLPCHAIRLGTIYTNSHYRYSGMDFVIGWASSRPGLELRTLSRALVRVGYDSDLLFDYLLRWYDQTPLGSTPPEMKSPFFAERLDRIHQALLGEFSGPDDGSYWHASARSNALRMLSTLPALPDSLHRPLLDLALTGSSVDRKLARELLAPLPDLDDRLLAELTSTLQARRTAAAAWLADRGATDAREPLREAARKEKGEVPRAALLSAFERLGGSVEEFVGRDILRIEAAQGLKKGLPKDLEWLRLRPPPAPRWVDTGEPVEPESVQWLVAGAHRLKAAAPGPLLLRYAAMMTRPEMEELAGLVLVAWLGQAEDPQAPAPSRGLLAFVAAFGGPGLVRPTREFVYRWYGQKALQCKALLEMLSWMECGQATQVLLAVADRFQTRGIQDEARRLAHELAERRGWSPDQLADRTCPTAGFSSDGVLPLDYGPRTFQARLDEALNLVLFDPEGRLVKALPKPRKDDDEEQAARARKFLAQVRKDLKDLVRAQSTRLSDSMAVGRTWSSDEWTSILWEHPLLKRLAVRILWQVRRPDGSVTVVRPLDDGTLTAVDDEEVAVGAEDRMAVAHETMMTPAESEAWSRHLEDYRVETLFPQLGRRRVEPSGRTALDDFHGHVLSSLELRNRANRLGYARGPVGEDGGCWYFHFRRNLSSLDLRLELRFSGVYVPESVDMLVALHSLAFLRQEHEGGGGEIPLDQLPATLLSECWHQLEWIAAGGPGFDPDWEVKVETM